MVMICPKCHTAHASASTGKETIFGPGNAVASCEQSRQIFEQRREEKEHKEFHKKMDK